MSKWGSRCACEARVIRLAVARGWVRLERTNKNHVRLMWPPTRAIAQIPSNMDDGFARRTLRRLQLMEKPRC